MSDAAVAWTAVDSKDQKELWMKCRGGRNCDSNHATLTMTGVTSEGSKVLRYKCTKCKMAWMINTGSTVNV